MNSIWKEGWQCRVCKKIHDSVNLAEECCSNGNVNNRRIDYLFNGSPTLQELKDLRYTISQRMKKLSEY